MTNSIQHVKMLKYHKIHGEREEIANNETTNLHPFYLVSCLQMRERNELEKDKWIDIFKVNTPPTKI